LLAAFSHSHDDLAEQAGGTPHHVFMPARDGIEVPGYTTLIILRIR